jgi:hypothetical protein
MEVALIFLIIYGFAAVGLLTNHQRKMAELRLRTQQDCKQITGDRVAQMHEQLTDLRDITTRYDLSFDQALQRIESRVGHFEDRLAALEQADKASSTRAR